MQRGCHVLNALQCVLDRGTELLHARGTGEDGQHAEGDEIADEVVGRRRHQRDDRGPRPQREQTAGRIGRREVGRGSEHHQTAAVHRDELGRVSCGVRLAHDLDAVGAQDRGDPGARQRQLVDDDRRRFVHAASHDRTREA